MFTEEQSTIINNVWNSYSNSEKAIINTKKQTIQDIDSLRKNSISQLKTYIDQYLYKTLTIGEFKTLIDSYNKKNNYWGFPAIKGQMFFNQLAKTEIDNEDNLNGILRKTIGMPADISEAKIKIGLLDQYCQKYFNKAIDKRTAPNPGSVCYFLSYFWQIFDSKKWPIMYTSLVDSFKKIGCWSDFDKQEDVYNNFYDINLAIVKHLEKVANRAISYWDIEHAFWNFNAKPDSKTKVSNKITSNNFEKKVDSQLEFNDYIIPKIAKLIELGADTEHSSAKKGFLFEQVVAEAFKQLDFDIEVLGQGSGRNPDIIAKNREDNTAFLIDAKAYSDGYNLGLDNRAIKEYINSYCPKLAKDGYKKIGFIIISNSFKSDFDEFSNEVTWNSDIKRFILMTSEALLFLIAYKTKDKIKLSTIIENIVSIGNPITAEKIKDAFEDI